jgi:argininosuccinate synthase
VLSSRLHSTSLTPSDFSPEREFVEIALVASQKNVTGVVRMAVYRGNVSF